MDEDLLRLFADLPVPKATAPIHKKPKAGRKPRAAKAVKVDEAELEQRLAQLGGNEAAAADSVVMKKAARLDKIRQLLAEQKKAEDRYKSLEDQIVKLIVSK